MLRQKRFIRISTSTTRYPLRWNKMAELICKLVSTQSIVVTIRNRGKGNMVNGIPDGIHFLYIYSFIVFKKYELWYYYILYKELLFKLSVYIAFTLVLPLKKQYLYTFEYFIQIKTSGKTQFKLFHHHFCLNIRFFMYFRLGASLLPVKMAAI